MPLPARAQIHSLPPDGTGRGFWLGEVAPVTALKWSSAMPGGDDQMSCLVQLRAAAQHPALAEGRIVQVFPGPGAPAWDGELDEPTPGPDGWQVTAHGAGTFGGQYLADYSGAAWGATSPRRAVDNAIARTPGGLRWIRGASLDPLPDGAWLGQAPDQGQDYISDLLDLVCSRGGLTWQVKSRPAGNVLNVVPWPTTVTRLLVVASPVARTIAGVVNAICARYLKKADDPASSGSGSAAVYDTVWVENEALIGTCGRHEKPLDLSNSPADSDGSEAVKVCQALLGRYVQAAFAGPFDAAPGQYLTATGVPVALATERAGEVVRPLVTDCGGLAAAALPVTFPVGTYEYDDESGCAVVTPAGAILADWESLVASVTGFATAKGDPFGLRSGAA